MYAASYGHLETVKILIEANSDIDATNEVRSFFFIPEIVE